MTIKENEKMPVNALAVTTDFELMPNQYRCVKCRKVFERKQSIEEIRAAAMTAIHYEVCADYEEGAFLVVLEFCPDCQSALNHGEADSKVYV